MSLLITVMTSNPYCGFTPCLALSWVTPFDSPHFADEAAKAPGSSGCAPHHSLRWSSQQGRTGHRTTGHVLRLGESSWQVFRGKRDDSKVRDLVIQAGWGSPKHRILIQAQMIHERNKKISSCYLTVLLRGLAMAGGTQAGRLSLR